MLQAGFGIVDITPEKRYPMAGFDLRKDANTGVHDPLSVRVILLDDGTKRCVFCQLDLLGVPEHLVRSIQDNLQKELGADQKSIQVSAIHTHAAPQSVFTSFACFDADYVASVNEAAVQAGRSALKNLHPVATGYAHTMATGVGSYRDRVREESAYAMPCDTVVFEPLDDANKTILLSVYACHPTVLNESNLLMSRDLVYGCDKRLAELVPNADVMFLNGACADISSRYSRVASNYEEVERLGSLWAEAVAASLPNAEPLEDLLMADQTSLFIPPAQFFTPAERKEILAYLETKIEACQDSQQKREYISCRSVLQRKHYGQGTGCDAELHVIGLGNLVFCSLPFEYASVDAEVLAKEIGVKFGKIAIICCYSNGYEGYLPSGRPLDRDSGYEDMASGFRSDAKQLVAEAFGRMLGDV